MLGKNDRPIATLPILYKRFSGMLRDRPQPFIISAQSSDREARQQEYSTSDHMLAVTLLVEGCSERGQD
eukprot:7148064-Pyramimonas_sp.AAC.1